MKSKLLLTTAIFFAACFGGGNLSPTGDITAVTPVTGGGIEGGAVVGQANIGLLTTCSSNQILKWGGSAWACAADVDTNTTYTASTGLSLGGTAFSLNMTTQSCSAGQHISAATAVGVFTCTADSGSSYTAGTNLNLASSTFNVNPTLTLAGANNTTTVAATNSAAGQTVNVTILQGGNSASTFNTTAGALTSTSMSGSSTSTRSAGANNLTNIGLYANASGGQINYSGYFDSGSFQVNGAATFAVTVNSLGNLSENSVRVVTAAGTGISKSGGTLTLNMTAQSCSAGQHISAATALGVFTCSADAGGGVTNSAGNNVVMKSDGTNAVASSITDNGTTVTTSEPIIVANKVYITSDDTIGAGYATNGLATLYLNWYGYNNGLSQFRNLEVDDGKGAQVALFTGSTKNLTAGSITSPGLINTTGTGAISSNTYLNAGTSVYSGNGGVASMFLNGNGIGCAYGSNATDTCLINAKGYQEGTTQFRNLNIQDGKGANVATFTGSTKATNLLGALTVAGDSTANGDAYFGDANTDKVLIRSNLYSVTTASAANKPTASSCGTSGAVTAGGSAGFLVTPGTGSPSSCTVTFATAFADTPACSITRIGGTSQQWPQWSSLSASAGTFEMCNSTACGGNTLTASYAINCVGTSLSPGSP